MSTSLFDLLWGQSSHWEHNYAIFNTDWSRIRKGSKTAPAGASGNKYFGRNLKRLKYRAHRDLPIHAHSVGV
jgi:hypothetical protein